MLVVYALRADCSAVPLQHTLSLITYRDDTVNWSSYSSDVAYHERADLAALHEACSVHLVRLALDWLLC
jgi:hypothetical protein